MCQTFTEASNTMAEALLSIQELINVVIQGPLEISFDGDRARNLVRFIVSLAGEHYIQQRCLRMTEGFCEYLDTAKFCLHRA